MNIQAISISDYTYPLPDHQIAIHPLPERDASRLLVYRHGQLTEDVYRNIDQYLPAGSLLVFNDTRVIEARLLFQKESGGVIEIFCLEPGDAYPDVTTGMQQAGRVQWKCLIGGASKWKHGLVLRKMIPWHGSTIELEARYIAKQSDYFIIELQWTPVTVSFAEVLHAAGVIPLPPYIKRTAEPADKERYQTMYAAHDGSVAAPTAGLHFTPAIFQKLQQKNIQHSFVTLHVGAGTFKPVKSHTMKEHEMHAEFIAVSADFISLLQQYPDKVYAVGTTAARTLESLYWMGVKTCIDPTMLPDALPITQWEVYEKLDRYQMPVQESLQGLLYWMNKNDLKHLLSKTQLLIAPGYGFKIIKGLVTNFHQPQSTLLLLVAALVGNDWKNVYSYALDHDFRFLSYGDGCLLEA